MSLLLCTLFARFGIKVVIFSFVCVCVFGVGMILHETYVQMCVRESMCVGLKLMPSVFLGLCVLLTKAGSLTGSTACQLYLATQLLW